jgi:hypothetical protein
VVRCGSQPDGIVLEMAHAGVAGPAYQPPHLQGVVAVIDVQRDDDLLAYGAPAALI